MKGYLSVKKTAEKWGISVRWVNRYIREGRVPGCEKLETVRAVDEDAVKPEKMRPDRSREKGFCLLGMAAASEAGSIYFFARQLAKANGS